MRDTQSANKHLTLRSLICRTSRAASLIIEVAVGFHFPFPQKNMSQSIQNQFTVVGIGELLWDIFPDYKRLGGAPANFAYHTHQLGAESWPVSCVGLDPLGAEVRSRLLELGVDSCYIKKCATYPTGTVNVVLHAGKPIYDIRESVAWDHIPFSADLQQLAGQVDAACFGSLSQRSPDSRASIHAFLNHMPEDALKIFDINLRQSFFSKQQIHESLEFANILKLSDEELSVLSDYFELEGTEGEQLRQLLELFDLQLVAYTRGHLGSLLIGENEAHDFPGYDVSTLDTVGAGDSFTAALCIGMLKGWPLSEVNQFANKVAAYVCSQMGATPRLPLELASQAHVL